MKKVIIFFAIVMIIIVITIAKYGEYLTKRNLVNQENAEYEQYKEKEVYGLDVATIINKAIDKNTRNGIEKDENGEFISNNINSIELEIYMLDNETTYNMETIYEAGIEQFIQYYGYIIFKCSKIEYHEDTGRVKYILFEQL